MRHITRREGFAFAAAAAGAWSTARVRASAAGRAAAPKPRIRKAILLGMLPKDLPLLDRFALARKVGFEGIEIPPVFDVEEQRQMKDASDRAGLPIHSIIFGGWNKNLADADPRIREDGTVDLRKGLECAAAVGADVLLLVPAVVKKDVRYVEAWQRSQIQVRKVLPVAAKLKVTIAIEEVWNDFLLSPLEMVRYVDEFRSPWVRAYFDVGNVVRSGYPQDWIRTLGKRIVRVHLKDYRRKDNKWVGLGEGDVDWAEVRRAFAEVGFEGPMTTELASGDETYLRDVSERVDRLLLAG